MVSQFSGRHHEILFPLITTLLGGVFLIGIALSRSLDSLKRRSLAGCLESPKTTSCIKNCPSPQRCSSVDPCSFSKHVCNNRLSRPIVT
ncbi:hypothetical protein O6P43_013158 [Quillaja saponaria]|uniref:Uncharacterized protein n=1 Tax=Quillaja saponaria TaxID=32244 RepID=A0AAD7M3G1_QUISA|nr:hypothetical protein O6P43_013158 [Quillaja saponaria]